MKPLHINRTPKYHSLQQEEEQDRSVNVDMNPMVDLAFLLLTFFMLATTFNLPQVMELVLPLDPEQEQAAEQQPVKESTTITLLLAESDQLYWYQGISDVTLSKLNYRDAALRELLLQKQAQIPELTVLIKPAPKSNFQNLVDILDEMNANGIGRYAIVDFEPSDQELLEAQQQG